MSDVTFSRIPVFLVGATGTGKSAVAMELARAQKGGVAILAMDAMQVYRGADIGTSKPGTAEQEEFPHGGIDLAEFGSSFDVAQYLKHAEVFLREQREAGRRVIIVGGTGLYFRALTQGLCEAPQGSDELRAELNKLSVEDLQERLKKIDPAMLARLDRANPRRLIRAIEVKEETGRSLHEWQEETPEPLVGDFAAFWIERSKEELAQRIEARVEAMFAQGWVKEVQSLVAKYGIESVRNFPGIGYGEIAGMFRKTITELPNLTKLTELFSEGQEAKESIVARSATATLKRDILVATRQYAKRQLTWFSREPILRRVMLSGTQPLPAALLASP